MRSGSNLRKMGATQQTRLSDRATSQHLVKWLSVNLGFDVDGNTMTNTGVYLELVPQREPVFTDTYSEGWKPSADQLAAYAETL